jgi:hypothetical protein
MKAAVLFSLAASAAALPQGFDAIIGGFLNGTFTLATFIQVELDSDDTQEAKEARLPIHLVLPQSESSWTLVILIFPTPRP